MQLGKKAGNFFKIMHGLFSFYLIQNNEDLFAAGSRSRPKKNKANKGRDQNK